MEVKRDGNKDSFSHMTKLGELYCRREQENMDKRWWRNDIKVEIKNTGRVDIPRLALWMKTVLVPLERNRADALTRVNKK